ncbi:glycosyltransferase family 4 protein [Halalkalibaculum sp. DA3122]|uniref:glycosyltransferase family 4 protein n=1 Tax=unclassified Halalkalibaculum TaxID=2964617 RepID=UPI0037542AE5
MSFTKLGIPLKVGIVANEFFDTSIGRVGGFGWAAKRAAQVLSNHPESYCDVCFLTADKIGNGSEKKVSQDIPYVPLNGNRLQNFSKMFFSRIDILLTIDYRISYRGVFNALPFTPIVVWVRDPWSPQDVDKIMSLKIPGKEDVKPAGIYEKNTQQLSEYANRKFPKPPKVKLANKMPYMRESNEAVYGLPESEYVLPNPSVLDYTYVEIEKARKPTVIFLGRLDPIKRPWVFIELARKFPNVNFLMLGQNHFNGNNGWSLGEVPENVKMLGHVTGEEKLKLLSSAWVLVNTSIHEEAPVSVLEAFALETPVLSYEDWGGLVERYGITIGQHKGTGLEGLLDLEEALNRLLSNDELRRKYGKEARYYVETEHNNEIFLSSFRRICLDSGVEKASKCISV